MDYLWSQCPWFQGVETGSPEHHRKSTFCGSKIVSVQSTYVATECSGPRLLAGASVLSGPYGLQRSRLPRNGPTAEPGGASPRPGQSAMRCSIDSSV